MNRVGLALLVFAPLSFAACAQILSYDDYTARGPDATTPDSATVAPDTAVSDVADADPGPARAPARPPGATTPSGSGKTLWIAIKRMYIGSTNSLGARSPTAWKEFGFDLDGVCTSLDDSIKNVGTCRRNPEASQDFLVDGDRCRDNNFGHHVIQLLTVSSDGFEARLNEGLFEGSNTWVIRIDDLDDGANDAYAPAKLYRAASAKGEGLKWDGTDVRKVQADSVIDRDLEKPVADFPKGYLRDNVWVSGEPERRHLVLPVSDELFVALNLEATLFTVALNDDHKGGTRGVVGGAIPMTEIEEMLRPIASGSGFCPGTSLYASLLRSVQRFPDVVVGAPNLQDTTVECNGLSLGLAFDVAPIQPATQIVDAPPGKPDPCVDAGPADAKSDG